MGIWNLKDYGVWEGLVNKIIMVDVYMKFKGLWCMGGVSQQKQSKLVKKKDTL